MKTREDEIVAKLQPLLEASQPYLLAKEFNLPEEVDPHITRALFQVRAELGEAVRAFFELRSVLEDVIACHRMVQRYPWNGRGISRSRYLRLVWFQFMNLCYLFREKFKLFANCHNKATKIFGVTLSLDLRIGLKSIDETLGVFIKNRGMSFHEWYQTHDSVKHFELIEVLNLAKKASGPIGDIKGHYSDAKFFLSMDIRNAVSFMEKFVLEVVARDVSQEVENLQRFNKLVRDIEVDPTVAAKSVKVTRFAKARK